MLKIRVGLFFITFFSLVHCSLFAQNETNSPYTRFGYGHLGDQSFGGQRAMGGIGYGLRDPKMINPLNPASFSSVDSLTFMLDMGVMGQVGWYSDGTNKASKFNGNIEYVAMQFPLYKKLGMGIGFRPVSYVGYKYGTTTSTTGANTVYSGTGGLNQVYGALSYSLFERLSLGVNVAYLFGNIKHDNTTSFSDATSIVFDLADTLRLNGLTMDIGLQYMQPLGNDQRLVFGAVYTPKLGVSSKFVDARTEYAYSPTYGTSIITRKERDVNTKLGFEMPESYGVGVTYSKLNKLTFGGDFLYQKWADAKYYDTTDSLKNMMKVSLGGEYIPNAKSRNYFNRIRYRAGGHYSDSYFTVDGAGLNEYGASIGLGLPMTDGRSFLNVTFEYTTTKPEKSKVQLKMIDEQYFKITVSYIFNELWFYKRKVQ